MGNLLLKFTSTQLGDKSLLRAGRPQNCLYTYSHQCLASLCRQVSVQLLLQQPTKSQNSPPTATHASWQFNISFTAIQCQGPLAGNNPRYLHRYQEPLRYSRRAPSLHFCQGRAEKAFYLQPSPLCRHYSHGLCLFFSFFQFQVSCTICWTKPITGPEGSVSTYP